MLVLLVLSLLWARNWPNGCGKRVSSDWWLSLGHTTDKLSLRPWITSILACDNSNGISKSGSAALMVHLRGCGLILDTRMVLTLVTGSHANLVCFLDLMALFSGTNVSEIQESYAVSPICLFSSFGTVSEEYFTLERCDDPEKEIFLLS